MSEYIICYDITNPRRLGRIHRTLKQYAVPLQYSVFLFTGSAAQLAQCLARLQAIMDEHSDDIRAYPLPLARPALYPGAQQTARRRYPGRRGQPLAKHRRLQR